MTRKSLVLFFILQFVMSAHGQRLLFGIDTLQESYNDLQDYVYLFEENDENIDTANFSAQEIEDLLKPIKEVAIHNHPTVFWGGILFQNDTDTDLTDWVFETGEGNFIDVFVFDENGQEVAHERTGQWLPAKLKRLDSYNRKERVFLSLPRQSTRQVLMRVQTTNYVPPDFKLKLSKDDFYKNQRAHNAGIANGIFLGFMVTMIFFNLIFFIPTKDKAYLYQFILLVAITVFMLEGLGILADAPVLRNYPKVQLVIVYTALIVMNIAYIQFIRYYTNLKSFSKKWNWFLIRMLYVNLLVWALLVPIFWTTEAEFYCDQALAVLMAAQYIALLALMLLVSRTGERKNYYIVAACLTIIIGVFVNGFAIAFNLGIQREISQVILALMVILFFLGLAYRMKVLRQEEHRALHLQEVNEMKNHLYTNITHEFRTPLTVIKGMAEEMLDFAPIRLNEKMAKAVQAIGHNGDRLLLLVNRLLDMAKLESGQMKVEMKRGDVISFLSYLVHSFDAYARSKKIHLQFLSELPAFTIDFDADKVQQIVSNLLSNAIKFTPEGGRVYFSAKISEANGREVLACQVKDTGRGIPPDELGKVFGRFYQTSRGKKGNEGTGIGLALAEELVKLMDGKIWVKSELGMGSTFHFELPVRHEAEEELALSKAKPSPETTVTAPLYRQKKSAKDRIRKPASLPQLLIIEDDSDVIYFLQSLLEDEYEVSLAFDGAEGIRHAIEAIPDIIVSDVVMPKKDGFEVLATLKKDHRTSHIPIVLLTAKATIDDRIAGLQQGADAYLSKPFHRNELFAILQNMTLMQERLRSRYENGLPEKIEGTEDAFLLELKKLLEANLEDEHFGIPQVCRALRTSRTQLHRKLKALTGKSTSIFIRSIRLQKARELLVRSPELNISEVAYAVGFRDPSFFAKTFSEEFGMPPSQFRA